MDKEERAVATREAVAMLDVAQARDMLKELSDKQRKFLRLRFLYDSDTEAAVACGFTPNQVKQWKKSNGPFKETYQQILIDPIMHARAELVLLAPKAVGKLSDMLDSQDEKVVVAAVDKVLKGKDAMILGNSNIKVENESQASFYAQLLGKMAAQRRLKMPTVEDPNVIDAESVRVLDEKNGTS